MKRYGKLEKANEKLEIIEIYLRNIITSQNIQVDKFFISDLTNIDIDILNYIFYKHEITTNYLSTSIINTLVFDNNFITYIQFF